jgi:iron complex outermembrane receptor protein
MLTMLGPQAPASAQTVEELKRMTLQELMAVEVSTVMREPVAAVSTPAALFVITQDDIRRAGATSLPEALRLAPGIQVARIDAARWAIGIRGFADRLARSMLVLIDGRAVYSPLFAGTYWEAQDLLLEDVERIEVIRGPGGTLWGANAVNGIINIVTRRTLDTHGTLVTAAGGSNDLGLFGVRHGGTLGDSADYRAYVKGFTRGPMFHTGGNGFDDWRMGQAGFRIDSRVRNERSLTVQGDLYRGELGQRVPTPSFEPPFSRMSDRDAPLSGGNVLVRWRAPLGSGNGVQIQTYYDRTRRDERPVAEVRDTFDADFQYSFRQWPRQSLTWGAAYRASRGDIDTAALTSFTPSVRTDHQFSAFVQNEIAVAPERLRVTLGAKVEHNEYTGVELQPSVRFSWGLDATTFLVGSVTRAVRTPSRVETDYSTNSLVNAAPTFVRLLPNPDFASENLTAYELGYRMRPLTSTYVTVSTFFNHLTDTLGTELLTPFVETTNGPPRLILPVTFDNTLHGSSYGAEVTIDTRPAPWWRIVGSYSHLRIEMTRNPDSMDVSQERRYEGLAPAHMGQLQSSFDLPAGLTADWLWRGVTRLPAGPVPAYHTSDVRVGWMATRQIELSVVGRNLHDRRHQEWESTSVGIERGVHVQLAWRR